MKRMQILAILLAIVIGAAAGESYAGVDITKTFEFGPGTQYSVSNYRTFYVPCHTGIEGVVITYRRAGTAADPDVPIIAELRSPGPDASTEGPIVRQISLTATRTAQTSVNQRMTADPSPRGCEIPWRVRIRAASGTNPPVAVTGSILFVYFGSLAGGDVEGGLISLSKGNSVTKNIGGSGGMHAGRVRVTGTWLHSAFGVPGPLPVQLRFQILRPDGTVAASKTAYSNGEINPCCSGNKMNFILDIRNHTTGQWKLRITNNSDHDVMNIDPKLQNVGGNCPQPSA